jgi:hypothetical protein
MDARLPIDSSSRPVLPELRGWRDLILAASLANLCLLKIWSLLLEQGVFIPRNLYLAAFLNLAVLTAALWAALRLGRRNAGGLPLTIRGLLAFLFLVVSHGFLTVLFLNSTRTGVRDTMYVLAVALGVWILASRAMARRLVTFLLAASPFVLMTVAQSAWRMYTVKPLAQAVLAPRLPVHAGAPRVVWGLFDAWDYGLSYPDRDPSLRLPELDRLEHEVLFAEHATSPGPHTPLSVPFLMGDTSAETMGAIPNIFSRAREHGINAGVVGWFFPYCDQFGPELASCVAFQMSSERNSMGSGILEIARNQLRILMEGEYRGPFGQILSTQGHAQVYRQWVPAAEKAVSDPNLSLVFLHAPVPHEPPFFDRTTGRYDVGDTVLEGLKNLRRIRYPDSLELMDRTIGELRQAMEKTGVWESSAVILTSDHPYQFRTLVDGKPLNPRVPFLVKLPGQREGLHYQPHFETVHTSDLVLAILSGEIARTDDLVQWLDAHARHTS